jgi:hypothetical protein
MLILALAASACRVGYGEAGGDGPLARGADAPPGSGPDASGDAVADPCATPGILFCDDFAAGIDGAWSMSTSTGGVLTWVPSAGPLGDGAVQMSATAYSWASLDRPLPAAILSGPLHARVLLRLAAGSPIVNSVVLFGFDNVVTPDTDKVTVELHDGDQLAIAMPFSGTNPVGTRSLPRETWACLELALEVDGTGTAGRVDLFLDGEPVIGDGPIVSEPAGGWASFGVAVAVSGDEADVETLVDEVLVGRERIGCP